MRPTRALVLAAVFLPTALFAQTPARTEIVLADFSFTPAALHLKAGQAVTLHFVNRGSGGHNFDAPDFFAAARIDPASAGAVKNGKVELKKGLSADVTLVPAKGKLSCPLFASDAHRLRDEGRHHRRLGARSSLIQTSSRFPRYPQQETLCATRKAMKAFLCG